MLSNENGLIIERVFICSICQLEWMLLLTISNNVILLTDILKLKLHNKIIYLIEKKRLNMDTVKQKSDDNVRNIVRESFPLLDMCSL